MMSKKEILEKIEHHKKLAVEFADERDQYAYGTIDRQMYHDLVVKHEDIAIILNEVLNG